MENGLNSTQTRLDEWSGSDTLLGTRMHRLPGEPLRGKNAQGSVMTAVTLFLEARAENADGYDDVAQRIPDRVEVGKRLLPADGAPL